MQNVTREHDLSVLRARIAAIEKRPLLAEAERSVPAGRREDEDWQALLSLPAGLLHEVYADEPRNGGAALGFALGLGKGLLTPERPALLYLHLVHEGQELGLPYGAGLMSFGMDPGSLILGRMQTLSELLWAVEEAIACRAVAGVVADVAGAPKGLDFTASRRLSLRAAGGGASVFMLRYGRAREATAARLRWAIRPVASQSPPADDQAPGPPRWQVTLEKGRLGPAAGSGAMQFVVEWTENGFAPIAPGKDRSRVFPGAAPYGAPSAPLGDGLSQTG